MNAPTQSVELLVSVVIPVYRDWPRLRECLLHLSRQTMPKEQFEVIVVSNEDTPPAPDILACAGDSLPNLHIAHEPKGFSYAARNYGVSLAQGSVVAFTDSDCRPQPEWLSRGYAAVAGKKRALLGGRIKMLREKKTWASLYDSVFGLRQDLHFRNFGALITANIFVTRDVFGEGLRFNAMAQSGADMAFSLAARHAGCEVSYSEDVIVDHPARSSMGALFRKVKRVCGGAIDRIEAETGTRQLPRWFINTRKRPPLKTWYRLLAGLDRQVDGLSTLERAQIVCVRIALFIYESYAMLRAYRSKQRHKSDW